MRGRKPTPSVIKLAHNNPGRRPMNDAEPTPDALSTECPPELTEPDARREWARVIVPAIDRGQVTSDDRVFAVAHCELWATWRSQLADAAKFSHVVAVGKNKYPMPNPARVMSNKTFLLLAKVDAELGFSPSSRTRVKVSKADGVQDEFAAYQRARGGGRKG